LSVSADATVAAASREVRASATTCSRRPLRTRFRRVG
jgi:hypothetical protein